MVAKHFHAFVGSEKFQHRWFMIHQQAAFATTDLLKQAFIQNLQNLCDNFGCKNCQEHFQQYLSTHSFDGYMNMIDVKGRDIGMFEYTRLFHNQVNMRLGKPTYTFNEVYDFYAGTNNTCTNCDKVEEKIPTFKSYRDYKNVKKFKQKYYNHVE